jgi:hypothetical protein
VGQGKKIGISSPHLDPMNCFLVYEKERFKDFIPKRNINKYYDKLL